METHMTAAPARKIDDYAVRLQDMSLSLSEIELRRILSDCKALLSARSTSTADAASLQMLIGQCYRRLSKPKEALDWYKKAAASGRTLQSLTNLGLGLIEVGDAEGALNAWSEAVEKLEPGARGWGAVVAFSNLAEGLMACGATQDAWSAFQEALDRADMTSPGETFVLAHGAAELGADKEAAELFARHMSVRRGTAIDRTDAVTFLRSLPADVIEDAFGFASVHLRAAIARSTGALHLVDLPVVDHGTGLGDGSALTSTRADLEGPLARANSTELPEHAD
jgi:tetratricopeptide (TPR) repeat protein